MPDLLTLHGENYIQRGLLPLSE